MANARHGGTEAPQARDDLISPESLVFSHRAQEGEYVSGVDLDRAPRPRPLPGRGSAPLLGDSIG